MYHIKSKSFFYCFILLMLSIPAIWPFFHTGFFPVHDNTQVQRVFEMFHSLKSGMFPVRWVSDLGYGYGYPIFTFYAPFAYYFGALWMFFGFNALVSTKIMIVVGIISAGIWMYLLAREFWGEEGGFVSGLLYLYAPYHALNTYVRGAIAELWGMAFVPLLFYAVWKTYKTGKWRYVLFGSIGYSGLILSHNLSALMVTPFLAVVLSLLGLILVRKKGIYASVPLVALFSLGILLSSFYWIPAIGEMGYTNVTSQISGTGSKYIDHFVCPIQLWDSPWGYAGSAPGCVDGLSFRIGKLHVVLSVLAVLISWLIYKKSKEKAYAVLGSILICSISIFLIIPSSLSVWRLISPMAFFQFPWRFLLLVTFFMSFVSGSLVWLLRQTVQKYTLLVSILLLVTTVGVLTLYLKLFKPQVYVYDSASKLTAVSTIRWTTSQISDEYMPRDFEVPNAASEIITSPIQIKSGKGSVIQSSVSVQKQVYQLVSSTGLTVLLNTAPFPAWVTTLDGKEIRHTNTSSGIIVTIPPGKHTLQLAYVSTQLEKTGNILSLTSMLGLLVGIIYLHKKKML